MKKNSVFWILACCTLWSTVIYAKPSGPHTKKSVSSKKQQKAEWPLTGIALPVKASDVNGDGGVRNILNERWEDVAELLKVPELRVRDWPHAFNYIGGPERIQKRTIEALREYDYQIEQWKYEGLWGIKSTPGFDAVHGEKHYAAIWLWNGSHLMLYWGLKTTEKAK
jgi:hypothetical protein